MKSMNKFYFTMMLTFLVLLLGYFSYEILRPFLYPIAWAIVLSILFYPVYAFLLQRTRLRNLSALVTLGLVLLILIGPATYLFFLLGKEAGALANLVETGRADTIKELFQHPLARRTLAEIASLMNVSQDELIRTMMNHLASLGRKLVASVATGIGGVIMAALGFIVMAMTLFFALRDAPSFLKKARDYLPFSEDQKDALLRRASDMVFSTIYGGVVVAVAQGIAGGAAFALLGIATPVLWGFVMAIASFLPIIGPSVVWAPAAMYLFLNGMAMKGTALVVAGLGIAAIDYFLRPLIIGTRTQMPFLIIFFSVIGGLQFFGLIGFILGPLVLALFFSVLDVFGGMKGADPERGA
jgi:predicted PurR-regulated permease PerM